MAEDPSNSRLRTNAELRERLLEKVQLNVTETGKLGQQLLKSSRSHEILSQTTKQFVNQERALVNSNESLKESAKIITYLMEPQLRDIQQSLKVVSTISDQLEPAWSFAPYSVNKDEKLLVHTRPS
ncbi:uncharacterized protein LOC114958878 isoform X1 [Acropora millepora]|uniref:uncharacterized protein LOC114958878 isoform X1 n=1 Tax=Acropora millepora TaxID=45264 RepID=UPI001CF3FDF6|nr:uncharacterized protein LOC114958878 isoform X1 [Acropora millepora]